MMATWVGTCFVFESEKDALEFAEDEKNLVVKITAEEADGNK